MIMLKPESSIEFIPVVDDSASNAVAEAIERASQTDIISVKIVHTEAGFKGDTTAYIVRVEYGN